MRPRVGHPYGFGDLAKPSLISARVMTPSPSASSAAKSISAGFARGCPPPPTGDLGGGDLWSSTRLRAEATCQSCPCHLLRIALWWGLPHLLRISIEMDAFQYCFC